MSGTPSSYVAALLVERQGHPERKLAIDAELVREGWYVTDDGELAQVRSDAPERADAEKLPENTAEPAPKRQGRPAKNTAAE